MKTIITTLLLFGFAATAFAQVAEIGLHGGASRLASKNIGQIVTATTPGARGLDVSLADGWRFGFRLTVNNYRFLGSEFGYAYNRTQLRFETTPPQQDGMAIHQGFYNFLAYATPEGNPVRPFVTGGGHFSNFVPPGASVTEGSGNTKFGFNYGGGIKVRITPTLGIRFDLREYVTGKPFDLPNVSGMLRQMEISAGFSLLL